MEFQKSKSVFKVRGSFFILKKTKMNKNKNRFISDELDLIQKSRPKWLIFSINFNFKYILKKNYLKN
jgi:hypothetical protein